MVRLVNVNPSYYNIRQNSIINNIVTDTRSIVKATEYSKLYKPTVHSIGGARIFAVRGSVGQSQEHGAGLVATGHMSLVRGDRAEGTGGQLPRPSPR